MISLLFFAVFFIVELTKALDTCAAQFGTCRTLAQCNQMARLSVPASDCANCCYNTPIACERYISQKGNCQSTAAPCATTKGPVCTGWGSDTICCLAKTPTPAPAAPVATPSTPQPAPAAVNCQWSAWSQFNSCSQVCGGIGTQQRQRVVQTPASNGGESCTGSAMENANCTNGCYDCQLSEWSSAGMCSMPCGGGTATRTRSVIREATCACSTCASMKLQDTVSCNTFACGMTTSAATNCVFSEWSQFSTCSQCIAANGLQVRTRAANPATCGPLSEMQSCTCATFAYTTGNGADTSTLDLYAEPTESLIDCYALQVAGGKIDGNVLIRPDEPQFKIGENGIQCIGGRLIALRDVTIVYPLSNSMGDSIDLEPAVTASDIQMSGVHLVIESQSRIQDQQTLVIFKGSKQLSGSTQFATVQVKYSEAADQCVVTTAKQNVNDQSLVVVLSTHTNNCGGGLSAGIVAVIVIVVLLIVFAIISAAVYFYRKERAKSAQADAAYETASRNLNSNVNGNVGVLAAKPIVPATEAYTTQREGGTMQMNAQVGIYQTVNNINDYDTLHARPSTQPQQFESYGTMQLRNDDYKDVLTFRELPRQPLPGEDVEDYPAVPHENQYDTLNLKPPKEYIGTKSSLK